MHNVTVQHANVTVQHANVTVQHANVTVQHANVTVQHANVPRIVCRHYPSLLLLSVLKFVILALGFDI